MSTYVIGKIPGYNTKIEPGDIKYTDRLLNNLTVVRFTPIGYKINMNTDILDALDFENIDVMDSADMKDKLKKAFDAYNNNRSSSLYKLGSNINNKDSYTALTTWQQMQQVNFGSKLCDEFDIIATSDSTINETLSNDYGSNVLENIPQMLGTTVSNAIRGLKGASSAGQQFTKSVSSDTMMSLLETKSNATNYDQFFQLLTSQMLGIQTALPKTWTSSSYNNTSSFTVKLVSPGGHPDDIEHFIIKPLKLLTLAISPVTFDGVSFGYPPIWRTEAEGLYTNSLTAMTAMTISRGGQDTLFNRYNQPTNIDVRITVEPLVTGFATPMKSGLKFYNSENGTQAIDQIVASPNSILDSVTRNGKTGKSKLELKPLTLNK